MYLKRKKKNGFVLLEVIAFLAIVMTMIMLYSKITSENIIKSTMYTINDDIFTLNDEERELIEKAEDEINSVKEIKQSLSNEESYKNLIYEKYSASNGKMKLIIKNGRCFIAVEKVNTVFYRELSIKKNSAADRFIIIPSALKGYNFKI